MEMLVKLYEIRNSINDKVYVGVTRNSLNYRWNSHRHAAKTKVTPLYTAIRKYGIDKFFIECVKTFDTEEELLKAEKEAVTYYRSLGRSYNILDGGESYFPIKDKEAWKNKLKEARKGRTPALGMKHSEENKKVFSECGKRRWDIYGRYPKEITNLSFKDAKEQYGISKTHYYRLLKLAKTNDLS